MAFIFTMRSTPVGGMHRRELPSTGSLPVISEDGRSSFPSPRPPPVPPKAWNRPPHKVFGLGTPPRFNFEGSPPAYNHFDGTGVEGPNGEKLSDVRKGIHNNKHIAKRGGWKRLASIAVIAVLFAVGLVVGLVIGLRNRHSGSSTSNSNNGTSSSPSGGASGTVPPSSDPNPASNATFPAGSYSISTFLDTVSTNCTSKAPAWTCYPYSTYAQSPSQSTATFDWIISPIQATKNYTISSTQNYFSIVFTNLTMSLMNPGAEDEHYFFQTSMQKPTKPNGPLTGENVQATCYFNSTTFQAYLYTKMPRSYPNISAVNTTEPFALWPYAVKIEQVAAAGSGTPTCLDSSGNSLGDFSVSDGTQLCDCLYLNSGT